MLYTLFVITSSPTRGTPRPLNVPPHEIPKVKPHVREQSRVLMRLVHALLPYLAPRLRPAELPSQYDVESLHLSLGPPDTGAHHDWRKARLEAEDRVADDHEVDIGNLPDVPREVALEDTLPVSDSVSLRARTFFVLMRVS